jgi:hypothetical protein
LTQTTKPPRRSKQRRKSGLPYRGTGWKAPIREKVSRYAEKGYLFEVRFWNLHPIWPEAKARDAALEQMKRTTTCRVIGPNVRYHCRAPQTTHRLYLRTEADLLVLRMLCDDLFRIYRLVPRKAA